MRSADYLLKCNTNLCLTQLALFSFVVWSLLRNDSLAHNAVATALVVVLVYLGVMIVVTFFSNHLDSVLDYDLILANGAGVAAVLCFMGGYSTKDVIMAIEICIFGMIFVVITLFFTYSAAKFVKGVKVKESMPTLRLLASPLIGPIVGRIVR